MTKEELIAKQQIEIEELKQQVEEYRQAVKEVYLLIYAVGAPLNDNLLKFNKEQRRKALITITYWKLLLTIQTRPPMTKKIKCLFLLVLCSCVSQKENNFCKKYGYDYAYSTIEGTICVKKETFKSMIEVSDEKQRYYRH